MVEGGRGRCDEEERGVPGVFFHLWVWVWVCLRVCLSGVRAMCAFNLNLRFKDRKKGLGLFTHAHTAEEDGKSAGWAHPSLSHPPFSQYLPGHLPSSRCSFHFSILVWGGGGREGEGMCCVDECVGWMERPRPRACGRG